MIPWWKRLAFSLSSVLCAGSLVGIAAALFGVSANAKLDPGALLAPTVIVVIASLAGWLVAIPIVLLVRDYSGWRVWLWGIVGISIGPLIILGIGLYASLTDPHFEWWLSLSGFLLLATAVSTLSTLFYLLLVHPRKPLLAASHPL